MALRNVNVLCPNGRREIVKVSPNTRILEIIEKACQKQKYNPDEYNLKHQRTVLDAQVPFRYANIPNNAKLELVKSDRPRSQSGSTVVALQLSTGERLQHSFESTTSLWELLLHWEGQGDRPSLTKPPSSSAEPLHPVCIYMREEIIGEAWLKATTLKGLGLTGGKVIIRLLHRNVELPPPPKSTQPNTKPEADPKQKPDIKPVDNISAATAAATPPTQMVSSSTPSNAKNTENVTPSVAISPSAVPRAGEATPHSNELAPVTSSSDTSMDCATSENRDESPMDVDSGEVKVEKGQSDSQIRESEKISDEESKLKESEERTVRPKEASESSEPSTSREGGSMDGSTAEEVMKSIEESAGLSLDEYAKRRIHALLEKEEEMVQSMQEALMESFAQQQQAAARNQPQPQPQPPRRAETRKPAQPFADFKFPESNAASTSSGKGKGKAVAPKGGSKKLCERKQLVFSPDQKTFMSPSEVPDDFFNVTVDDVRRMLSDLRHQSGESERTLETKAMKEARDQLKMRKYDQVVVRVHFPDRLILQGFFYPQETVGDVRDFVKSNLAEKDQTFYLYTTPPKTKLMDMSQTLFKAKLFPAAVIYFGSDQQTGQYLHEDLVGELGTLLQAESVVAQNMSKGSLKTASTASSSSGASSASGSSTSIDPSKGQGSSSAQQKRQASPSNSAVGSTKVPKWFKVGKK